LFIVNKNGIRHFTVQCHSIKMSTKMESCYEQGRTSFDIISYETGLVDQELGKHFDLLFDSRQEGDYADFVEFDANEVADWLYRTKEFVDHVDTIICTLLETTGK